MTIDINLLRSLTTVLLLCIFIGIVVWAWSGRQRARFAEAALIPLEDETAPRGASRTGGVE